MNQIQTISPSEANSLCERGAAILLDVRTPAEYAGRHARRAVNLPIDSINKDSIKNLKASAGISSTSVSANQHGGSVNKVATPRICVICESGGRSRKAAQALVEMGETDILDVQGGTRAWETAGLPLNRGKGVISLDRQVRIAAGFIVVLGVVLGYFVSANWFLLSGFVGAGLMFAGITDTCGLAMVLAKMPWNKQGAGSCGSCC